MGMRSECILVGAKFAAITFTDICIVKRLGEKASGLKSKYIHISLEADHRQDRLISSGIWNHIDVITKEAYSSWFLQYSSSLEWKC